MKIFIGADHNGFDLKAKISKYLTQLGHEVLDAGDELFDPKDDFTVYASRVAQAVITEGHKSRGILVCGSGQGMMIAANRFRGIRAGLGYDLSSAASIRNDEDSNVLALPSSVLKTDSQWQAVIDTWLTTPFAGAVRFKRRNMLLDEL